MTISVTSSEARKSLGKLLHLASEENEEVVINVRGEPTAVLVSYSQYEQLTKEREARKREEALRLLRSARARVAGEDGGSLTRGGLPNGRFRRECYQGDFATREKKGCRIVVQHFLLTSVGRQTN